WNACPPSIETGVRDHSGIRIYLERRAFTVGWRCTGRALRCEPLHAYFPMSGAAAPHDVLIAPAWHGQRKAHAANKTWPEGKYPKGERAQEMQRRELVANF